MVFNQSKMKIKFPSGTVGYEIRCLMGAEDSIGHLLERPQIVQDMYHNGKLTPGKVSDFTFEEIKQLESDVTNAIDIKADHIDDSRDNKYNWTSLHQYHLTQFLRKLYNCK